MGRVTRKKAAEIAERLHVDEDAVLDMNAGDAAIKAKLGTPEERDRSPLGEIAPNSAESNSQPEEEQEPVEELKKSTRGRKAGVKKGAAKGKNNNLAASTATMPEEGDVVPDDNESAPSPASEKAAEELLNAETEGEFVSRLSMRCESIPVGHMTLMQGCDSVRAADVKLQPDRSQSPPSAAVRLTRSQLAKRGEFEPKSKGFGEGNQEQDGYFVSNNGNPSIETSAPSDMSETATATVIDAPASPLPTAVPNVIKNLRTDTPAKRSTSNKENVQPESEVNSMASPQPQSSVYDALEDAVVSAATPPRSEARASPVPQDPIAALDELEDAVESVSKDIPEVQTSPEKPKTRNEENMPALPVEAMKKVEEKKPEVKKESKRAAPVVRTTKAAQARLSMAQNKDAAGKAPALGKPRPSTTLDRSTGLRQSVAPKPEATTKRITSNPTTSATARSKPLKDSANGGPREKEAVIPHSKPRPVSLSFPTPPPPPKSTKAATQSTFQLPGEAIAAKLKAAREARMAKEAEEADKKKAAFKARPAPKAGSEVPAVRQTNASRARESIMAAKPAPAAGHKRSNTVANTERPRNVSKDLVTGRASTTTTSASARPPIKARPSTSLANISKPRASTTTKPTTSTTSTLRTASGGNGSSSTTKGKEVFARAANAKFEAEKAKQEKECAAKKARAEAAERGRVASREWAEKQRLRKLGMKKGGGVEGQGEGEKSGEGAEVVPGAAQGEEVEAVAA